MPAAKKRKIDMERKKTLIMGPSLAAPHNIIILRALQLGDLLCTVPAFRALRAAYPAARVTLVGLPWAEEFVRRFSHYLDDFIAFPGWPGLPESEPQVAQIPGFLASIQQQQFDLAIQMQGSGGITNPLIRLFGARQEAGYYTPGQYRPNEPFFFPYPEGAHEIKIFTSLLVRLGIPNQGEALEFPIAADERQAFTEFQAAHKLKPGSYACLHPGARALPRRWHPKKMAVVADGLSAAGLRVVITGSAAEQELTQAVLSHMRAGALNVVGQTSLGMLAQLLEHAALLVSNDTGVSHIAAAFGTPSVILFTTSDPNRWRPLNRKLHRAVLNAQSASPGDVLREAEDFLGGARRYA